ncbi:Uma2 family endonuclease [Candidatus Electronema sp. JC]|uniref:Uma2 family endonuclease n=1 Tax=Candidatus Electronema sp. JC TaxID=3401570 RepID=UPI003AA8E158
MPLPQHELAQQISEKEYLEGELLSDAKHEFIDGAVYAMAGASADHGRIAGNLFAAFLRHLQERKSPCEPFQADMKVKAGKKFFYPDVLVSCEQEENDYYRNAPLLIVEVVSQSTRKTDNTVKRLTYQNLPSLKEYVLIEQDFVDVEVCRRINHWRPEHYYLGDAVHFASVDLTLPVEDIYARVMNDDMLAYRNGNQHRHKKNNTRNTL